VSAEALDLPAVPGFPVIPVIPGAAAATAEHLIPVPGGAGRQIVPAVTAIDLVAPGPGDELVAHLTFAGTAAATASPDAAATAEELLRLFDAMRGSRWLEVAAHRVRAAGVTSAVPGPAGREIGAVVALAVRRSDPALLPFGWRAFEVGRGALDQRTNQLSSGVGRTLLDLARGLVGSAREPMGGSRNPIGGHPRLAVLPHTCAGGGHLPRAVGIAWTIGRQERLPDRWHVPLAWPDDAIVVAGLDAADADYSVVGGAIDAVCRTAYQGVPLPLLIVCADDATGASSRTPPGWIEALFAHRPGLEYRFEDASDLRATLRAAKDAARYVREQRTPLLLHVRSARLVGAEPDRRDRDRDPIRAAVRSLVEGDVLEAVEVGRRWTSIRDEVVACVEEALREPLLGDDGADDVMAPLAPHRPVPVAVRAATAAGPADRARAFAGHLPEDETGLTLAESIRATLLDAGAAEASLLVFGAEVAGGGRYGVTSGLRGALGSTRVVDTLPDARAVLGLALGAGSCGLLAVAEVATPAALHAASDQLRGEAASASFSSVGAYRNPLVVRVPGLAHRPGPAGSSGAGPIGVDHAIGALRDVPGLVVACPAHPSDAPGVLRTCLAAAATDGTVSVVLEPVELYAERDLHTPGDGGWLASYPPPDRWESSHIPIGQAVTWGDGSDVTVVTYGHGLRLALRVAARLARSSIGVRVVDLRWLAPLPVDDVLREASATRRCLVVDEARRSGGVAEALVTALLEGGYTGRLARINADDSFVPPGPAADLLLISEDDVEDAVRTLL
jgi:2-oxoisovalerate dehydrogenase E1 component